MSLESALKVTAVALGIGLGLVLFLMFQNHARRPPSPPQTLSCASVEEHRAELEPLVLEAAARGYTTLDRLFRSRGLAVACVVKETLPGMTGPAQANSNAWLLSHLHEIRP